MEANQQISMSDQNNSYSWRSSIASPQQSFQLTADGLRRSQDEGPPELLAWREVRSVKLEPFTDSHRGTAYQLRLSDGENVTFVLQSSTWQSLGSITYQDGEFLNFARSIHGYLLPYADQIDFLTGERPRYVWAKRIVVLLFALMCATLTVVLALEEQWTNALVFACLAAMSALVMVKLVLIPAQQSYDPNKFMIEDGNPRDTQQNNGG